MNEARNALDEALAVYEDTETPVARTWRDLVIAAVGLGAALARFDLALKAHGAAKRGES